MPRVLTIYCCGSGSNREKSNKWLVPHLWEDDKYDSRKYICDGVGAGRPVGRRTAKKIKETGKQHDFRKPKSVVSEIQNMHGTGVSGNVLGAANFIENKLQSKSYSAINMIGWSRGAVTCIMLAHYLQEKNIVKQSIVNIFAIDPVPGGEHFDKNDLGDIGLKGTAKELPTIVKKYSSIIMMNIVKWKNLQPNNKLVNRKGEPVGLRFKKDKNFPNVVPSWPAGSGNNDNNRKIYPLPGNHSDAVRLSDTGTGVNRVGYYLAYRFLTSCGTEFKTANPHSHRELIEGYAEAAMHFASDASSLLSSEFRAPVGQERVSQVDEATSLIVSKYAPEKLYVNGNHYRAIQRTRLKKIIDNFFVTGDFKRNDPAWVDYPRTKELISRVRGGH